MQVGLLLPGVLAVLLGACSPGPRTAPEAGEGVIGRGRFVTGRRLGGENRPVGSFPLMGRSCQVHVTLYEHLAVILLTSWIQEDQDFAPTLTCRLLTGGDEALPLVEVPRGSWGAITGGPDSTVQTFATYIFWRRDPPLVPAAVEIAAEGRIHRFSVDRKEKPGSPR